MCIDQSDVAVFTSGTFANWKANVVPEEYHDVLLTWPAELDDQTDLWEASELIQTSPRASAYQCLLCPLSAALCAGASVPASSDFECR